MPAGRSPRPLIFYSPPLRRVAGRDVIWTYQTVLVGADGQVQLIPCVREWAADQGRAACARHVLAQINVDRDAARASGADIGIVAVHDATSWDDLKRAYGLPTHL
jgi:hypothetical protein